MAIHLAEALTGEAKKMAKGKNENDPDASLAFYRITGSLVDDYDQIVSQALTHEWRGKRYIDTLGAWFLGDSKARPHLDDLLELAALLGADDMARGPTRQLMTLMGHGLDDAQRRYGRWRRLLKERNDQTLKTFDRLLTQLANVEQNADLPYGANEADDNTLYSPLGDALALTSIARGKHATRKNRQEEAA